MDYKNITSYLDLDNNYYSDFLHPITENFLNDNPEVVFVYGDNLLRQGKGGGAKLRDHKQTYGFVTKKEPNNKKSSYFSKEEYQKYFAIEAEQLEEKIVKNSKQQFYISKLSGGLANKNNIFTDIISPWLDSLKEKYKNVYLYYFKDEPNGITSFSNENLFLSNFAYSPIRHNRLVFPTAEHFFQSMKTNDFEEKKLIAQAKTPRQAKHMGRWIIKLDKHWEERKNKAMHYVATKKFLQNPKFAKSLLDTNEKDLVEGNWWGDTYWGVDINLRYGKNVLGQILQQVRFNMKTDLHSRAPEENIGVDIPRP